MSIEEHFLEGAIARFELMKQQGDRALVQCDAWMMNHQADSESNSIATIVIHLHGTMLSRWTDFLTTDGEKVWRQRDKEFDPCWRSTEEVLSKWEEGWAVTLHTLRALNPSDLLSTVRIRQQPLNVLDAILRQIAHYSYHIGALVHQARELVGAKAWNTLSIARGKSSAYVAVSGRG